MKNYREDLLKNRKKRLGVVFFSPFEPVVAEKLDRVLCPDRAIAADQRIGRAILIAAPTHSLRVLRMKWDILH